MIFSFWRHDGLLKEEYIPDVFVEHTAGNLWREMLRFKACISGWMLFLSVLSSRTGKGIPGQDGSAMRAKEGVPQNPDDNH